CIDRVNLLRRARRRASRRSETVMIRDRRVDYSGRSSGSSTVMQIAAIDIGTNSLHMIVVRVRADLSFEVVDREKEMVRLGAGGLDGRALTPEAMHTALQVMSKFRRLADSHGVDQIIAVATRATREAQNG